MLGGCKQKMADGLMTFARNLTLTCCGKQRRYFEIFGNMADTRANFKPNLLLIGIFRYAILNLRQYGDLRGNFKPNFKILCE